MPRQLIEKIRKLAAQPTQAIEQPTQANAQPTQATEQPTQAAALEGLGKLWEKGGHRRLYLDRDAMCRIIGLEIEKYKSGSVRWASLDGERISNSAATRILLQMEYYCYYDLVAHRMIGAEFDNDGKIAAAVEAALGKK